MVPNVLTRTCSCVGIQEQRRRRPVPRAKPARAGQERARVVGAARVRQLVQHYPHGELGVAISAPRVLPNVGCVAWSLRGQVVV